MPPETEIKATHIYDENYVASIVSSNKRDSNVSSKRIQSFVNKLNRKEKDFE